MRQPLASMRCSSSSRSRQVPGPAEVGGDPPRRAPRHARLSAPSVRPYARDDRGARSSHRSGRAGHNGVRASSSQSPFLGLPSPACLASACSLLALASTTHGAQEPQQQQDVARPQASATAPPPPPLSPKVPLDDVRHSRPALARLPPRRAHPHHHRLDARLQHRARGPPARRSGGVAPLAALRRRGRFAPHGRRARARQPGPALQAQRGGTAQARGQDARGPRQAGPLVADHARCALFLSSRALSSAR